MGELVECLSGFTYADKPVALSWEGRRLEIIVIQAEWLSPDGRHFRVRTNDGQDFELIYFETDPGRTDIPTRDAWQIIRL
jgi:hypothetical protein